MKNIKCNRGVTLTSLVITVIVFIMILSVIGYSTTNGLKIKDLNNMYADIRTLEDKIAVYYLDYGTLPLGDEVTNISNIDEIKDNPNNYVSSGKLAKFYKIDLSKIENISLSNGKSSTSSDVYIINEQSHSIYYLKGIDVDDTTYHTIPTEYSEVNLDNYQS